MNQPQGQGQYFHSMPHVFNIHIPLIVNVFMQPQTSAQGQGSPQFNQSQQQQQFQFNPYSFFFPFLHFPNVPFNPASSFNLNDILQASFQQAQQQQQGPPPVKKETLAKLPVFKFNAKRSKLLEHCTADSCTSCAICQCDFECNDELVQLPCQHLYHKNCCMPWIQQHNTCPICRFEMEVDDVEKEKQRKQKMAQIYGATSLRIMELASLVSSEYIRVEREIERAKQTLDKVSLICSLRQIDANLEFYALELDKLGELNGKVKEQRRRVLLLIQGIQKEIDEAVSEAQQVNPDDPIIEDDPMNVH